jgi:hypothetical protein
MKGGGGSQYRRGLEWPQEMDGSAAQNQRHLLRRYENDWVMQGFM